MAVSVKISGLEEIEKWLEKAPEILVQAIQKALANSVAMVETEIKKRTPVKTGYLQSSIGGERGGYSYIKGLTAGVGTNVEYAWRQEMGDSFRHPISGEAHFTEKGAQAAIPYIEQEFEKAMNEVANSLK